MVAELLPFYPDSYLKLADDIYWDGYQGQPTVILFFPYLIRPAPSFLASQFVEWFNSDNNIKGYTKSGFVNLTFDSLIIVAPFVPGQYFTGDAKKYIVSMCDVIDK